MKGTVKYREDQSYGIIHSDTGEIYVRNRRHIRPDWGIDGDDDDNITVVLEPPRPLAVPRNDPPPAVPRREHGYGFIPPTTTRSGRTIKPVLP